jgi:hypothetical protein
MIEKISWATYATALVIIVLVYYVVIALLYYRKEIFVLTNALQKSKPGTAVSKQDSFISDEEIVTSLTINSNAVAESSKESPDSSDISIEAFALVEKIKDAILQYAERQYIKEEVITGLQSLLKESPELKYSSYANSFNSIITKECATHCSIRLEDDEVKRLWV